MVRRDNCTLSRVGMYERKCVCVSIGEGLAWEGQAPPGAGLALPPIPIPTDISVPCNVNQCRCLMFCFIPSRPEEVGQFWLRRRATFDPKAWRAQCRCKHNHEDHAATGSHPCRVKGTSKNKGSTDVGMSGDRMHIIWG